MSIQRETYVVVPCYNEADRLDTQAFLTALQAHPGLHFVWVDDGSGDATGTLLDSLVAHSNGRGFALRLEHNQGKAEAVRRGMSFAFDRGAELAGYWDADLATPLAAIETFVDFMEASALDVVLGSRVLMVGTRIDRSVKRHFIGRVFATLASTALDLQVYDTQCGAKLLRNTPETRVAFSRPFELSWSFDVEMLARLMRAYGPRFADRCRELPLREWRDAPGSKITLRQFPKIAREMARMTAIVRAERRR